MQQSIFATGEVYHIYNRGVDKREIFLSDRDRFRFIHNLFEFNDVAPALNVYYRFPGNSYEIGLRKVEERKARKLLVNLLAFCMMPNHFHLLLMQKVDKGITEFMRKLGTGYTNYFNKKYERSGHLFQGKFKAVLVDQENYFYHLPNYIHLNVLELLEPNWKDGVIKNFDKVLNFLETYRWSSYLDYIGKKNFPSVTQRGFLLKVFNGEENYRKSIIGWLQNLSQERFRVPEVMLLE